MKIVTLPDFVIRPIPPGSAFSVNQSAPSGPAVMSVGSSAAGQPGGELGDHAAVVIRPMRPLAVSVNQRLPSGPAVIALGSLPRAEAVGELGDHAIRRDASRSTAGLLSTNQMLPSGPAAMSHGSPGVRPTLNSVTRPSRRHAGDRAVAAGLRDPEVAVRARRDPSRPAAEQRAGEVREHGGRRDAPEASRTLSREPEVAVLAAVRDVPRAHVHEDAVVELRHPRLVCRGGARNDERDECRQAARRPSRI